MDQLRRAEQVDQHEDVRLLREPIAGGGVALRFQDQVEPFDTPMCVKPLEVERVA